MLLLVSGSSGCGKNTIIKELLKKDKTLTYITSYTSREKRSGETEGNPYHFISKEEFQNKIKNGDFFEHELIHGNFYGIDKPSTIKMLSQNKNLIKDIGVIGTFNLKDNLKEEFVETIYLNVPKSVLKKRLKLRGDKPKDIKKRMKRYDFEKSYLSNYGFIINNNNLDNSLKIINKILINNKNSAEYIKLVKPVSKVNIKKVEKCCNKLINNKKFKPLKVYFNGKDFYLTKNYEKYLANLILNKSLAKIVKYKNIKIQETEKYKNVLNFIETFKNN